MRTWLVRIKTSEGEEYQELDLPTEKEAYDFAWEWWESDPEIRRLELTDSAGRADPLILDRYRTLKPTVWARKTEPSRSISDALNEGRIDEYGGPSFAADFADLALMYQERGFSQDEAEALAVADLRSRFPRRDSGGRIMSRKRAINNPYSPDTNPYLTEPPGVPDDLLDGPPHEYSFEPPDNEALQRVFEDREARRKVVGEVLTGDGIFGNWDSLDEALAQARDISPDVGPVVTFFDPATQMFVNVSEYDSHWFEDNPRLQFRKRTEAKVRREARRRTAGTDPRNVAGWGRRGRLETDPPMGYEDRAAKRRKRAVTISGDEYDDDGHEWPEGVLGVFDDYGTAWNEGGFMAQHERVTSYIFRDVIHGKFVLVEDGFEDEYFNDPRFVDEGYHMKRRSRIETDPPMGYVNEFFPPLGLLPDDQQFAEPFTDDTPEEDEVVARKQANWVATTETVNGMTVNVLTLDRGNLLINIIEGPEFLLTTGGRYIWTVTNLYGEEVAGGRENTAAEAQAEALGYIEDEKGLVSLPFAARLRAMTKDILISNPDLGMTQAQKLAAEVISTYPQVFGAHDDFVKKLMDEYDLTRADAETEAQYQYDQDPGTMDQWNVLDKTRQTTSGTTTVTTTPRLRFDTSAQWSYTKGSK